MDQDTIKAHGHHDVVILTSSKSTGSTIEYGSDLFSLHCIPGLHNPSG